MGHPGRAVEMILLVKEASNCTGHRSPFKAKLHRAVESHPNLAKGARLGWGTGASGGSDFVVKEASNSIARQSPFKARMHRAVESHPKLAKGARLGWGTRARG